MLWRRAHRRSGLTGVLDDNGNEITDGDEAIAHLLRHWAVIFGDKIIDEAEAHRIAAKYVKPFPDIQWTMDLGQFASMLASKVDSAPGPDGIPFSALRAGGPLLCTLLYACYREWCLGHALPSCHNYSWLWLLAKGESNEDQEDKCCRMPGDTRPLSGSNTSAKLLPSAFTYCVNSSGAADEWVTNTQRGFINGRHMLQNLADCEAHSYAASLMPGKAATVLIDYRAAFPSLARAWLFIVLSYMAIPNSVIEGLKELYRDNVHLFQKGSRIYFAFMGLAGVKQGCPASALLFALVTHPILLYLQDALTPRSVLRAYADDLMFVLRKFWVEAPALWYCFQVIARVSNLELNTNKCVIIPLWRYDLSSLKKLLREELASWGDMKIASLGKYLGRYVGPGAIEKSWDKPMQVLENRVRLITNLGLGHFYDLLAFKVYGLSVLQFQAQFEPPPAKVVKRYTSLAAKTLKGPNGWMPNKLLIHLRTGLYLDMDIQDLEVTSRAARSRLVLERKVDWKGPMNIIREAENDDDRFGQAPFSQWREHLLPVRMEATARELHKAGILGSDLYTIRTTSMLRNGDPRQCLQKILMGHFAANQVKVHDIVNTELAKRMRRWAPDDKTASAFARKAVELLRWGSGKIPPCAGFACAQTWMNGWLTDRRFQVHPPRRCVLCLAQDACDELEHYSVCDVAWDAISKIMFKALRPAERTQLNFLLLGTATQLELRMACLYAIMTTVHKRRALCMHSNAEDAIRMIVAQFQTALRHCKRLQVSYNHNKTLPVRFFT